MNNNNNKGIRRVPTRKKVSLFLLAALFHSEVGEVGARWLRFSRQSKPTHPPPPPPQQGTPRSQTQTILVMSIGHCTLP